MRHSPLRYLAAFVIVLGAGACTTLTNLSLPAPVREHLAGAEAGNIESQYRLGIDYTNGFGVAQDDKKAVEWLAKAAEKGHADASFMLGAAYGSGRGAAEDPVQALSWYERAAEANHPRAQYLAGEAYANGRGTAQDLARAAKFYRKAADQGHAEAMYALGVLTASGKGVKKDGFAAARWLMAADALGCDADDLLAGLKKKMPAATFAKAKREAEALVAAKS